MGKNYTLYDVVNIHGQETHEKTFNFINNQEMKPQWYRQKVTYNAKLCQG